MLNVAERNDVLMFVLICVKARGVWLLVASRCSIAVGACPSEWLLMQMTQVKLIKARVNLLKMHSLS